jgi:pimeloyl-ACP methyl ester carboxylesterase
MHRITGISFDSNLVGLTSYTTGNGASCQLWPYRTSQSLRGNPRTPGGEASALPPLPLPPYRLAGKDVTILWGMKDIAFCEKELNRQMSLFPQAKVVRLDDMGHFVSEAPGA